MQTDDARKKWALFTAAVLALTFATARPVLAQVETEPWFRAGAPRLLFEALYDRDPVIGCPNYDVSLDGQQFLMVRRTAAEETTGYVVVLNWVEELTRLVPTP